MLIVVKELWLSVMVVLVVSDWAALMVFMLDGSYGAGQRDEKRGCFFEFLEREKMMKASIFFCAGFLL